MIVECLIVLMSRNTVIGTFIFKISLPVFLALTTHKKNNSTEKHFAEVTESENKVSV